jgi:hypothetical protein
LEGVDSREGAQSSDEVEDDAFAKAGLEEEATGDVAAVRPATGEVDMFLEPNGLREASRNEDEERSELENEEVTRAETSPTPRAATAEAVLGCRASDAGTS